MARNYSKSRSNGHAKAAHRNGSSHHLYDDILTLAGGLLRTRKDSGAGKLGSLADATRKFANDLPEMPNFKNYVASAAEQIDDLSGYVMDTELEQMIDDAGKFARQHPLATLGIAAIAGFGMTKMITARTGFGITTRRKSTGKPTVQAKSTAKKARRNAARSRTAHVAANA